MKYRLIIDGINFTDSIVELSGAKITYIFSDLADGRAPSATSTITVKGPAYEYIKEKLIDNCELDNILQAQLTVVDCDYTFNLQIKGRGIEYTPEDCQMKVTLVNYDQDTRVIRALREKLAFDNDYWRSVDKVAVKTDYEQGKNNGDGLETYIYTTRLRDYFIGAVDRADNVIPDFSIRFSSSIFHEDSPYYNTVYATSTKATHMTAIELLSEVIKPNNKHYRYGRDIYTLARELKDVFNSLFIPVKQDDGSVTCYLERRDFFDGLLGQWIEYSDEDDKITYTTKEEARPSYMQYDYAEADEVSNEAYGLGFDGSESTWVDDYGVRQPKLLYSRYNHIVQFKGGDESGEYLLDVERDDNNPDRKGALEVRPGFEPVKVQNDTVGGILQLGNAKYAKLKKYTIDEQPSAGANRSRVREGQLQTQVGFFNSKLFVPKLLGKITKSVPASSSGTVFTDVDVISAKVKAGYANAILDALPGSPIEKYPAKDQVYRFNYPFWFNYSIQPDSARFTDYDTTGTTSILDFDAENTLFQNFWWIENPNAGRTYCKDFRYKTRITSAKLQSFDLLKYILLPGNKEGYLRQVVFDFERNEITIEGECN
jgi:hypothetical protein